IFLQQAGHNRHEHICESLELFAAEVLDEFRSEADAREQRKQEELAPWIQRAMARRRPRTPLTDAEIPVVKASRARAEVNQAARSGES
ncbi:MAG: LLM class flavin-dependent oxidoreductase, partial [Candidatus Binatia bacterium]